VRLYEYDKRFQRYGDDYTYYDYNTPEDVPEEHHHTFRVVVADPPYLVRLLSLLLYVL
jgi:predicted methyltransferase